jgi:hypothetical protein
VALAVGNHLPLDSTVNKSPAPAAQYAGVLKHPADLTHLPDEDSHVRSIARPNRAEHTIPVTHLPVEGVLAGGATQMQAVAPGADCPPAQAQEPRAEQAKRYQSYLASELAEDTAIMLADLEDELAIIYRDEDLLLAEAKRAAIKATDATALSVIDRSKTRKILANLHLPLDRRVALQWFLKDYGRSKWRKRQPYYPERIGISLLAGWECGRSMAYCRYKGRFCKQPDFCFQCALLLRIKPALKQYEKVYDVLLPGGGRRYWYALSPSFEWNPDHAGAHFVAEKRDTQTGRKAKILHHRPWVGQPVLERLSADCQIGEENELTACFGAIFELAEMMAEAKDIGILAHRHVALHFFEAEGYALHITPNGHFLLTTPEPLTFEDLKMLHVLFDRIYCRRKHGGVLYTDLHAEELTSQAEVNRWIGYMFQPMDFVTPYIRAIRRGIPAEQLNQLVDDRVFQGGNSLLCVPSPRRYGNLRSNGTGYFGGQTVTDQREEDAEQRKAKRIKRSQSPVKSAPLNYLEKQSLAHQSEAAEQ